MEPTIEPNGPANRGQPDELCPRAVVLAAGSSVTASPDDQANGC